jgi:GR25 family glycosyltransferase involved in LPS biosynthesis
VERVWLKWESDLYQIASSEKVYLMIQEVNVDWIGILKPVDISDPLEAPFLGSKKPVLVLEGSTETRFRWQVQTLTEGEEVWHKAMMRHVSSETQLALYWHGPKNDESPLSQVYRYSSDALLAMPPLLFPHVKTRIEGLPPIFWISLGRCKERGERMKHHLDSLGIARHTRVEGIDGSEEIPFPFSSFGIRKMKKHDLQVNLKTHALVMSHAKAMETFLQDTSSSEEWALIMEDDACFDLLSEWPIESFGSFLAIVPQDAGIVNLSLLLPEKDMPQTPLFPLQFLPAIAGATTLAYLLRRSYAQDFLRWFWKYPRPSLTVSDVDVYRVPETSLRKYMLHRPLFIFTDNNSSIIHKEHEQYQKQCLQSMLTYYRRQSCGGGEKFS